MHVSEISHFLTVIEFNTKFEEKHVGKSLQDILTPSTYRSVLTIAFRAQYEGKMELPHDMASFFLLSARLLLQSQSQRLPGTQLIAIYSHFRGYIQGVSKK
jgi:hypothetical protein